MIPTAVAAKASKGATSARDKGRDDDPSVPAMAGCRMIPAHQNNAAPASHL
jgi:hypothetical protein